jgi:hypothetical protein
MGQKNKKTNLSSATLGTRQIQGTWHSAKNFFLKKNSLPSAKRRGAWQRLTVGGAVTPATFADGRNLRAPDTRQRQIFADGQSLPSARHLALGKGRFADDISLPSAAGSGSRQRLPLPSVRWNALGKLFCTRQSSSLR